MEKYIYLGVLKLDKDLEVIQQEVRSFKLLNYYKTLQVVKFSIDHKISEEEKSIFKEVELEKMFHATEEE